MRYLLTCEIGVNSREEGLGIYRKLYPEHVERMHGVVAVELAAIPFWEPLLPLKLHRGGGGGRSANGSNGNRTMTPLISSAFQTAPSVPSIGRGIVSSLRPLTSPISAKQQPQHPTVSRPQPAAARPSSSPMVHHRPNTSPTSTHGAPLVPIRTGSPPMRSPPPPAPSPPLHSSSSSHAKRAAPPTCPPVRSSPPPSTTTTMTSPSSSSSTKKSVSDDDDYHGPYGDDEPLPANMMHGFMSARGKTMTISEDAMSKAKAFFESTDNDEYDLNDLATTLLPDLPPVVDEEETAIEVDDADVACTTSTSLPSMSSSSSTAATRPLITNLSSTSSSTVPTSSSSSSVSNKSLAMMPKSTSNRKGDDNDDDYDPYRDDDEPSAAMPSGFVGFTTGHGARVNISAASMVLAQTMMDEANKDPDEDDHDKDEKKPIKQPQRSPQVSSNSNKSLLKVGGSTPLIRPPPAKVVTPTQLLPSSSSVSSARSTSNTPSLLVVNRPSPPMTPLIKQGLIKASPSTASTPSISSSSVIATTANNPSSFEGFQTGSGRAVPISAAALRKATLMMATIDDDDNNDDSKASTKIVALPGAPPKPSGVPPPPPAATTGAMNAGFTTGAGRPVSVSASSLAKAQSMMAAVDNNEIDDEDDESNSDAVHQSLARALLQAQEAQPLMNNGAVPPPPLHQLPSHHHINGIDMLTPPTSLASASIISPRQATETLTVSPLHQPPSASNNASYISFYPSTASPTTSSTTSSFSTPHSINPVTPQPGGSNLLSPRHPLPSSLAAASITPPITVGRGRGNPSATSSSAGPTLGRRAAPGASHVKGTSHAQQIQAAAPLSDGAAKKRRHFAPPRQISNPAAISTPKKPSPAMGLGGTPLVSAAAPPSEEVLAAADWANRPSLRSFVKGNNGGDDGMNKTKVVLPPQPSVESLIEAGVLPEVINVTSINAIDHRFEDEFGGTSRGWNDMHKEMNTPSTTGGTMMMVSESWIRNHYRLIVWKLACMEQRLALVRPQVIGALCTYDRTLSQLRHRWARENLAHRSAIQRICEKDDAAAKYMVLCISNIYDTPGMYIMTCSSIPIGLSLCVFFSYG
jgi:hypothetical protein